MKLFTKQNEFIISSEVKDSGFREVGRFREGSSQSKSKAFLYGYIITDSHIFRNQEICSDDAKEILRNKSSNTGVFACISVEDDHIDICFDPLVQYSMFYGESSNGPFLTNSILAASRMLSSIEINEAHLYDLIAYQSPLRGYTILRGVKALQYDDLTTPRLFKEFREFVDPLNQITIHEPNPDCYSHLDYAELCQLYLSRLLQKSSVIASHYSEIQLSLTGGADSRLALAALVAAGAKEKISAYCFGDGTSQNRLIFEKICDYRDIRKSDPIAVCGAPLNTLPLAAKGLIDTNFRKLYSLNSYFNGEMLNPSICKVTGYYGANISGGVVLPPPKPELNARLTNISPGLFTYHQYVSEMQSRHGSMPAASFNDIFYINNRGPSHYASHTLAENLSLPSFELLYDPINIELVRKSPYTQAEINKNAITIDLIYLLDGELALFPYDSRVIPKYREFECIPFVSCFDGVDFCHRKLAPMPSLRPKPNVNQLGKVIGSNRPLSLQQMFQEDFLRSHVSEYPGLSFLTEKSCAESWIFMHFLLAKSLFSKPELLCV